MHASTWERIGTNGVSMLVRDEHLLNAAFQITFTDDAKNSFSKFIIDMYYYSSLTIQDYFKRMIHIYLFYIE